MKTKLLEGEINAEIQNRNRTLNMINTIPSRYMFSQDDSSMWTLCGFPIIYAVWEGFFVSVIKLYFREINKLNLKLDELSDEYFVGHIEKTFSQFREYPKNFDKRKNFLTKLFTFFRTSSGIIVQSEFHAKSNLNFKVMNQILINLHLQEIKDQNHNGASLKEELDDFLLSTRNRIVHGELPNPPSSNDITKATMLVMYLMELVKDSVVEGYRNGIFKK